MKLRPTQFGVHESTASPRQHASRLAGYPASQESARVLERPRNRIEGRTSAAHGVEFIEVLPTDSADVATAGKRKQTAHSVSVEDTNSARANPDARSAASHGSAGPVSPKADAEFEPLLDVVEAARLLRIHPKTLQKLARVATLSVRQFVTRSAEGWPGSLGFPVARERIGRTGQPEGGCGHDRTIPNQDSGKTCR